MERRLYRSRDDRLICGVCGGLAKYFDIDPVIVRIIALLLVLVTGVAILAYIIMAIVVPLESSQAREPKDVVKENVEEYKRTTTQLGEELCSTLEKKEGAPAEKNKTREHSLNILGIVLIVLGVLLLLNSLFSWLNWGRLWPIILIAIGLLLIFGARRK